MRNAKQDLSPNLDVSDPPFHARYSSGSSASLDPYPPFPPSMTPERRDQLAFYTEEIVPSFFPIQALKQAWNQSIIPLAFIEPALLHAILGFAAGTLSSIQKTDALSVPSHTQQSHKAAAIRLINRKLEDSTDATQLPTIYTVILLMGHEMVFEKDSEAIQIHLSGLCQIIRTRGGFDGLPWSLHQLCLFLDFSFAAIHRSMPLFPIMELKEPIPQARLDHISSKTDPSLRELCGGLLGHKYKSLLDPSMAETYKNLRQVTTFRESSIGIHSDFTFAEIEHFDIMALRVQHSLITFSSSRHFRKDSHVQNICSIAVPLFFVQNQSTLTRGNAIVQSLNTQLWEVLRHLDLEQSWPLYPDLLIWAFMFGVYTSVGQPERSWFLAELVKGTRGRFSWQWKELREILLRFFYFDRLYEVTFREICEEVRGLSSLH